MKCLHPECTGNHSGKWRIADMCPVAQEKRRASWRAYDTHLQEKHNAAVLARFGSLSCTDTVVNPDAKLDLRYMKRGFYKDMWQLQKRIAEYDERLAQSDERLDALFKER